jgi:hypothetical protein
VVTPLLACAVSVLGISCAGDCWSSTEPIDGVPGAPTPTLRPRYVLTSVNGVALPFTISSGATRVRLLADTLVFTGAGTPPTETGTYVEVRTIGTTQGTGAEVVTRTTSPARPWRRGQLYAQLLLEEFVGLSTVGAQAQMQLGNPALSSNLFAPGGSYTFEPR